AICVRRCAGLCAGHETARGVPAADADGPVVHVDELEPRTAEDAPERLLLGHAAVQRPRAEARGVVRVEHDLLVDLPRKGLQRIRHRLLWNGDVDDLRCTGLLLRGDARW